MGKLIRYEGGGSEPHQLWTASYVAFHHFFEANRLRQAMLHRLDGFFAFPGWDKQRHYTYASP